MRNKLVRLLNTVRHLRPQQVYGQARRRAATVLDRWPRDGADRAPGFPGCQWSCPKDILPPVAEGLRAQDMERGLFRFLNVAQEIGFPPHWDGSRQPKLWLYNLHYFDWLWRLDFDAGRRVALDWIREYARQSGRLGWEPYPTSLRLINWCGFFFGCFKDRTESDRDFCKTLWRSLYTQCEWLSGHVETHLLGNHYLENAAALVFVGACFPGEDARRWFDRGMRILSTQLREQILPDGVHFELSPMYHCRILYVLAVLMETGGAEVTSLVDGPLRRMSDALRKLCHPDGRIALLGDSAQGIGHEPKDLFQYVGRYWPSGAAADEEQGCFALPDAGYYGWRGRDGAYVIADFARVGPDHIPGHGHADIFSFELSLGGHRVITDSGVHDYEISATRRYSRSTAAHNTVEIDGCDQCELWGAFRVARRGYPRDVAWHPQETGFTLSGWHDGYRRLRGQPIHFRQMQWDGAQGLIVQDRITARRAVHSVSRLHLHPWCRIDDSGGRLVHVSYPNGRFQVEADTNIGIDETPYFEGFYEAQSRPCLWVSGKGDSVEFCYRIAGE